MRGVVIVSLVLFIALIACGCTTTTQPTTTIVSPSVTTTHFTTTQEIFTISPLQFLSIVGFDIDVEYFLPSVKVEMDLLMHNPNDIDVTVSDYNVGYYVGDACLLNLELDDDAIIQSKSSNIVETSVKISGIGILDTISGLINNDNWDFRLYGIITLSTSQGIYESEIDEYIIGSEPSIQYQTTITLDGPFSCSLGEELIFSGCLDSEGWGLEIELNEQRIDIQIDGHNYYVTTKYKFLSLCQNGYFGGLFTIAQVSSIGVGTHTMTVSFSGNEQYQSSYATSIVIIYNT